MKTYPFVALSVAKSPLFSIPSLRGAKRRGNPLLLLHSVFARSEATWQSPSLEAFAFVFCERGNPSLSILLSSFYPETSMHWNVAVQGSGQVLKQEAF